jgi:galactokinase
VGAGQVFDAPVVREVEPPPFGVVEVGLLRALRSAFALTLDDVQLALLGQRAENEFVGVRCGLMDQFVAANAQAGHALMLDCRSLDFSLLPLPAGVRLVVCNTMVRHALACGEYNARRAECEEGVRLLARALPRVRALRDVTADELNRFRNELPEVVYRRCRHVVAENARVVEAKAALEGVDLDAFGRLMRESHRSLRDDYEVSCAELDLMVELASDAGGVYGARMTGGGFGGCTINLVRADEIESFRRRVARGYEHATGRAPEIYVCSPAQGVSVATS